jgi:hypothetical protein
MTGPANAFVLGLNGFFYVNGGTYASPTWTLINNVTDLDNTFEMEEADATNRAASGFEAIMPTIDKRTLESSMIYNPGDTNWQAMLAAYAGRVLQDYLSCDGPVATAGSQGPRFSGYCTKFGRKEELKGVMMSGFTLRPGPAVNPPSWFVAA